MREISTKKIEMGEHVLIDGVEYVAEEGNCSVCNSNKFLICPYTLFCPVDGKLTRVEKSTDEQDKDTPMTNHELAMWCAKGFGQWKHSPSNSGTVYHTYWVMEDKEDCFVEANIVIRPWETDEWIKPTVAIYERDCR